jgi:asparagine synthetase B (glutamine-hydrolysing)
MTLATDFRETFIRAVGQFAEHPLLLSGGVDSATILAAQLHLGSKPDCYSFRFGDYPSEDNLVARQMAVAFGLRYVEVAVRRTSGAMIADAKEAIALGGSYLKTHVQVGIPFLYLCRALKSDGVDAALFGMAADDLWGSGRHARISASNGTEEFRKFRLNKITDTSQSDFSVMRLASSLGISLHDPYRDKDVIKLMLNAGFNEMHKPRDKALALSAFPEFWRRGKWYRPNKSLQVVSGIRAAHDTLLRDPVINTGRHRAIVGLYHKLANQS